MVTHVMAGQGVGNIITFHLITVIAVYALLILAARRSWLKPGEIPLISGAVIFWAIAWLLGPVIPITRSRFPQLSAAIPISIGMITPFIVAMIFGVIYVRKRMLAALASGDADTSPKKQKANAKRR